MTILSEIEDSIDIQIVPAIPGFSFVECCFDDPIELITEPIIAWRIATRLIDDGSFCTHASPITPSGCVLGKTVPWGVKYPDGRIIIDEVVCDDDATAIARMKKLAG
jgi:hypothetical protein